MSKISAGVELWKKFIPTLMNVFEWLKTLSKEITEKVRSIQIARVKRRT